jgi:hypothetical protein
VSFKQVELERGNLQPGKAEADGHDLLPETKKRDGTREQNLKKIKFPHFVASAPRYFLF